MPDPAAVGVWSEKPLLRGEAVLLMLPLFSVGLGYGAVLPLLPDLLIRIHAAGGHQALALHAGLLTGLYVGAFVVGAPFWGWLTDHWGPRRVLLTGLLGYAIATAGFGFAATLEGAYAARFVAGAFAAALPPATSAIVIFRFRGSQRARYLAWIASASLLGFLAGPALAGIAHEVLSRAQADVATAMHATAVAIWITGALALAAALGIASTKEADRPGGDGSDPLVADGEGAPLPRSVLLALSATGAFGLGAFEVGLPLQSRRDWNLAPGDLAALFVVCSLTMLAIQLGLFARLRRWLRPAALVSASFGLMAAGFALLSATTRYVAIVVLVALIALGSGVLLPALTVLVADTAGRDVGRTMGYQNAAASFGQAVGSVGAGFLFGVLAAPPFAAVAVLMLVAALAGGWHLRRHAAPSRYPLNSQ